MVGLVRDSFCPMVVDLIMLWLILVISVKVMFSFDHVMYFVSCEPVLVVGANDQSHNCSMSDKCWMLSYKLYIKSWCR